MRSLWWISLGFLGCTEVETSVAEIVTDDGLYALSLTPSSEPYLSGEEVGLVLEISHEDEAVLGALVMIEPTMPAMGHGISDAAVVTEQSEGTYLANWVFTMSGAWDVLITIDADAGKDQTVVSYEVE